jgi:membrane glycosyltransferase
VYPRCAIASRSRATDSNSALHGIAPRTVTDTNGTPHAPSQRQRLRWQVCWRRSLFFGLTLATGLAGGRLMLHVLRAAGLSSLALAGLVFFAVLFTWMAGAFWTAVAGFVMRLIGGDPALPSLSRTEVGPLSGRTAIVMPIYNEETTGVFAGVEAIWSSLALKPEQGSFDFFILSDTQRSDIARAEEFAWRALVARLTASGRLFYRRRSDNAGRKAGNIADFVRNWGGAYDYMIVLDADSIMAGSALVALARLMDAHPDVGILQSLPMPVGRDTLFARMLQFAVRLNGPMFASGLVFWQLGESNYWGHNAIVRLRPFAEQCALPYLPGLPPFGGEILSHDIVEAAFMRRAGYKTWLVPVVGGSWEGVPSNVIDYAARDRRWVQGNLQHIGVVPLRGLHWLSRVNMLTGVLSYAASPMWLAMLVLSSIVTCLTALSTHQYFRPGVYSLFPSWRQYRHGEVVVLLTITITLLMLPKLLGACLALKDRALRAAFGGAFRLSCGVVLEQTLSMLLAPTMMLFQSSFVLCALLGHGVAWDAQPRNDRGVSWREAFPRHAWHLGLGLAWAAVILRFAPEFIWWMLPVILGMVLTMPFTVLTSRISLGRRLRAMGLLLTPEETSVPAEIRAVQSHQPLEAVAEERPWPVQVPQGAPLAMIPTPPQYGLSRGYRRRSSRLPPMNPLLPVAPPLPV